MLQIKKSAFDGADSDNRNLACAIPSYAMVDSTILLLLPLTSPLLSLSGRFGYEAVSCKNFIAMDVNIF